MTQRLIAARVMVRARAGARVKARTKVEARARVRAIVSACVDGKFGDRCRQTDVCVEGSTHAA